MIGLIHTLLSLLSLLFLSTAHIHTTEAFVVILPQNICTNHQKRGLGVSVIDTRLHHGVETAIIIAGTASVVAGAWVLSINNNSSKQSTQQQAEYAAFEQERARLAHIEPKKTWKEEELYPYDGSHDDMKGPILLAVKGDVFNVYKGRSFYGPQGEYHIMAGRDATRFLAKNSLVEEHDENDKFISLNIAEKANLEAWYWTLKNKYECVGKLEGYDPKSTEM